MTERCYYEDAYAASFTARVVERLLHQDEPAVVLDRTYFYPASGGQPADRGYLEGISVLDVLIRPEDGAVVHVLQGDLPAVEVTGEIDWERRFDHMQQHTGQHILSQAFIRLAGAHTVGFHLSQNSVTIDLDHPDLEPATVERVELLANRVIWEDRPVEVRQVSQEEAIARDLRKLPDIDRDRVRLIEIADFDLTACGGTHVARTGAVGMIKILKLERRGDQSRVEFCCGKRALNDYRDKHDILQRLATTFTTGYWELENSVDALLEEAKSARRLIRQQEAELLRREAAQLVEASTRKGDARLVSRVFAGRDPGQVRDLAKALVEHSTVVALLAATTGDKSQLVFARAEDAPGDMNRLLQGALEAVNGGRGGGSAAFAQGGSAAVDVDILKEALLRAGEQLQ